jgi:alpha-beta hydrolase superfamily lysophospholipase
MSAAVLPLISAQSGASARPIYFGTPECRLFGWLHPAAQADVGVVVCQPFGYEAICAHRGTRAFAEAIAAAGIPAFRFDYLGTGDSAEIDPQADQLQAWTRDVLIAAEELQLQTGVKRICLLGFRLGAMLAALAAAQSKSVTSVISISPIMSGRRYLRELRTLRMAASMSSDPNEPPIEKQDSNAGGIEVSGFKFSAATLETLATVELSTLTLPQMLVIESTTTGVSVDRANSQDSHGKVTRLAMPGLVEMLMTPPQFAVVPKAVIAATLDWLSQLPTQSAVASFEPQNNASTMSINCNVLELTGDPGGSQPPRIERPVFFGPDGLLFGIVTTPPANEIRRRAVILLNAGADHHIGASRLYVSMARRWSQHGYVVLRMDLGGIGDSGTRPYRVDDDVFPQEGLDDIAAGIEYLKGSHGIRDVTLAGLCSGAYHALRAAVAGLSVGRILMVNPQNYFWKRGESLSDLQLVEVVRNPGVYREKLFSWAAWRRILTGRVDMLRVAKIYLHRPLMAAESTLRDIARRMRVRLPNDLGTELEAIVARGVRVVFVFARGEPGIGLLKLQAGDSVKRLAERCRIHTINGGDHVFTRSGPREIMENVVSDELFAQPELAARAAPMSKPVV